MNGVITTPKTLLEACRLFADQEVCFEFVKNLRWPNGVTCPFCSGKDHSFLSTRKTWQCKGCSKQFSVKKGSIFEDSPLKLDKWLIGMWLIANAKNGISSYEIHRSLGITQKSAWFLLHRIRLAMQNGTLELLGGLGGPEIEVDETFVGGKSINMHKSKREERGYMDGGYGKTIVMGMIERGGKAVCYVVPKRSGNIVQPLIKKHVKPGSTIFTDYHGSYHGLYKTFLHGIVDHQTAYVFGPISTNTCENFWSLLKRSIKGTYVSVDPWHLHRYVGEQEFRYNNREVKDGDRLNLVGSAIGGKRLTYKTLTGKDVPATIGG